MLDLFNDHPHLKGVPVYPIRGNHDMPDTLDKLPNDTNWHKDLWYDSKFQISAEPDAKYMSMLHLDSNLLICHVLQHAQR